MVKKKKEEEKTEEDIFLEELTVIVAARLKAEKWDLEDKVTKPNAKILAKRDQELKLAVQIERARILEEERIREEAEKKAAIEKEQKDFAEEELRKPQIKRTCKAIKKLSTYLTEYKNKRIADFEWQQYTKCDGLPNAFDFGEMSTYLYLWEQIRDDTDIDMAFKKTSEVLQLLNTMDDMAFDKDIDECEPQTWTNVRDLFRLYQKYSLDCLSYRMFRNIVNRLEFLDVNSSQKIISHPSTYFTICLWALVQLPIPEPGPKYSDPEPPYLKFPDIYDLEVQFPSSIDVWAKCVRAMYCQFEHFNHLDATRCCPAVPKQLILPLDEAIEDELEEKRKQRIIVRIQVKEQLDEKVKKAIAIYNNAENDQNKQAVQNAIRKQNDYIKVDSSAIYLSLEDEQYMQFHKLLVTNVPENIINLRRYHILGGVFFLELFQQPPQPTTMIISGITLATLKLPKWLESVPFHYKFSPPVPPEAGVVRKPEEIEEELRQIELEHEKMLSISLTLPNHVFWLDPPVVCQWDEEEKRWTTKDIHDAKYNEEKQTVQFKSGKFGVFGMAVYRYNSMPYQAWEMKPLSGNRVLVTIMAAVLILEFTISGSKICLSQLQNAPCAGLDYLIGQYMTFPQLKKKLLLGGVDVFPEFDSFCYMEGVCEKQWPMEKHLYYNMAYASLFFNFAWSRWNISAGRRKVVMQMREWIFSEKRKQQNYSMLLVTPLRATLIDCTEVSSTFNEEELKYMKYYADLYNLIVGKSTTMYCKLEKVPLDVVNLVAELLIATRVLSVS